MKIMLMACLSVNSAGNIYGGAEKSVINLANWLARNSDHEVFLVSVEGDTKAYPVDAKVHFVGNRFTNAGKLDTHLRIFRFTKQVIRNIRPDVIISYWIQPVFYAALSGCAKKIPMIYSERNDPSLEYGMLAKLMRYVALKAVSKVVFQTSDAKAYFSKDIQRKGVVIHNPVYLKFEDYPIGKQDNRVVAVGRLSKQKNYELLIRAFSKISRDYPELTLEIYGEGAERETLTAQIREAGTDKIVLAGAHPDVLDRIYGARMFVMTSRYEGMPNALMEAMCLGIPAVCSDCPCGGPGELIRTGENGYLFANNDEDDLIAKMRLVLDNGDNLELRNNEKQITRTHSQEQIFSAWRAVIDSSVKNITQ